MCAKVEAFFANLYARAKAVFGHSKIVFINIIGGFLSVYVELQDYLISFNWDDFFKHEVAVGIGLVTQVISVILRTYGNDAPISFKVPDAPDALVAPPAPEDEEVK